MTRVVVVDDHPVFRKGLVALLRASEIEVVGEAESGPEAIEVVRDVAPDLVLMDLGLPSPAGSSRPSASSRSRRTFASW